MIWQAEIDRGRLKTLLEEAEAAGTEILIQANVGEDQAQISVHARKTGDAYVMASRNVARLS